MALRDYPQSSLVPRPRPAFRRLQYGKALYRTNSDGKLGGAWERGYAQRMSALEERIEQMNDRMRELEEKLEENHLSRQQSTSTDEGTDPDCLTLLYPQLVENCCAPSVFVHGELEYESPHVSACPLHQDVSPHTHNWHCVVSGRTVK